MCWCCWVVKTVAKDVLGSATLCGVLSFSKGMVATVGDVSLQRALPRRMHRHLISKRTNAIGRSVGLGGDSMYTMQPMTTRTLALMMQLPLFPMIDALVPSPRLTGKQSAAKL